jgi:hypothetical protein
VRRGPGSGRAALLLAAGVTLLASGLAAQVPPPPAPPAPPRAPSQTPGSPSTPARPATPAAPQAPPARPAPPPLAAPAPRPGTAAPAPVVEELRAALGRAIQRFEARDASGVLAHVSDAYRTGPLNKTALHRQLAAMFALYDTMRARVRIDEVRLVGEQAWVWSSGEALGRLPFVGQWMTVFSWQRELEIARREGGAWRLYGYQE